MYTGDRPINALQIIWADIEYFFFDWWHCLIGYMSQVTAYG